MSRLTPRAFLFDAYGTLFDIHSIAAIKSLSPELSQLWRQKQIEYTWRRTLMQCYRDFWTVTEEALRFAAVQLEIELTEPQVDDLMRGYLTPALFPEVKPALDALSGSPLAILSNGSPRMLETAVQAGGLHSYLSHVISADEVRMYKPAPAVYQLGADALQLPAEEILFISANAWDAAGAKAYGYRVCWCKRSNGVMDALGFAPDVIVDRLDQIAPSSL